MAFDVNFWTFSKKERSTAQPTGTGTVYSCTANEPLDLLAPVISLKLALNTASPPTVYNYARIANFGRYYWVTGWEIRDGLWWASLRVDALASWKTQIGASSLYIYRSSYEYNGRISDSAYPQMTQPQKTIITLPKVWTVGGSNAAGSTSDSITILAGIVGSNGVSYYAFTPQMWQSFYTKLFSNQYYEDVLGEFGATEYPEAKVAINPLQYITSALMIPMGMAYDPNTNEDYRIPHGGTLTRIRVGNVYVPSLNETATDPVAWLIKAPPYGEWVTNKTITLNGHPQAATRGSWLNYAPYTEWEVFFPPVGSFPLEPSIIADAITLTFTIRLDYRAGTGMLDITAEYTGGAVHQVYRTEFPIGVPMQLSNVMVTGTSTDNKETYNLASSIIGGSGSSLASNANHLIGMVPVIGGIWNNGITAAIHGATPHLFSTGRFGSTSNMGGQPKITVTHWYLADEDNAGKGKPLCAIRQISNIPGFITAEADELSVSCTDPELNEIRTAVGSGFHYE